MVHDFDREDDAVLVEKRGRPAHEITPENQRKVELLRAINQNNEQIAAAIGISEQTLRRKYLPQLKQGRARILAELVDRLWAEADRGSVAAIRELSRQIERSESSGNAIVPPKMQKVGKKIQAKIDAAKPDRATSMGELMARRAAGIRAN